MSLSLLSTTPRDWHSEAIRMFHEGLSYRTIAAELKLPLTTLGDFLRKYKSIKDELPEGTEPKILVYDIENTPIKGYVWNMFKANLSLPFIVQHQFMLTWAAKWLGDDMVMTDKITNHEAWQRDHTNDEGIIRSLWELMDEAHITVSHNGLRHDLQWLNMRAAVYDLPKYSPTRHIDTCRAIKRAFKLPSNSLQYAATYFGLDLKKENAGAELWQRCADGDAAAIDDMEDYNIHDLYPLEQLYLKARPYIDNHPNLALYDNSLVHPRCPRCFSKNSLELLAQPATTNVSKFQAFRCSCCGSVVRGRKNVLNKDQRENIFGNVL